MRHLGAEQAPAQLAESSHVAALFGGALELLQLAAVEVEKTQRDAVGMHDKLALGPVNDLGLLDFRLDEHRLPRQRVLRRGERRLVFVAQRKVQHVVERPAQAQSFELARKACRRHPACRIASISTSAPRGSPETPTAARAG